MVREMKWDDFSDEPCCYCGEFTVVLADRRKPVNKANGWKRDVKFKCQSCNGIQMRAI